MISFRWVLVGAWCAAVGLVWYSDAAASFTLENLRTHFVQLQTFVAQHFLQAALIYVAVYIAVAVLALPVAVWLTVAGGALFGVGWGYAFKFVGAMVGATLVFLLAQGSLGAWVKSRFPTQIHAIQTRLKGHMFTGLLILRIIPLFPFFLVNIVPALIHMPLRTYMLATALGITPGGFVYTLAGAGLAQTLTAGGPVSLGTIFTPTLIASMAGMVLLALVPNIISYVRGKKL
ncbi:MAG: VTT domain-containing protein [Alphaproteobacteria bacterium]